MEAMFHHLPGGVLVPVDEDVAAGIDQLPFDVGLKCKFSKTRNIHFHRKFLGMLRTAFNIWEPGEISSKHGVPEKNFERFRKDAVILAGFYEVVVRVNGDVVIEPKSISFDKMEPDEFDRLYNRCLDKILAKVLKGVDKASINHAVDQMMAFA